jgi:pilus assembly protein CpaB
MKLLRNKFVIGTLCIVLALLFAFVALPALTGSGESEKVSVLRMKQTVQVGTQLAADMLETVNVPKSLVQKGISELSLAVGKYAVANLYAGDYLTTEKLTTTLAEQNLFSVGTDKGKMVISVTLPSLASGVSGRLLPGDIVSVIAIPQDIVNQTLGVEPGEALDTAVSGAYIDPTLARIEVCMVTTSTGAEASVEAQPDEDTKNTLPVTVSFYVTEEQALKLAELEQSGTIHLAFVARGNAVSEYVPDSVLVGTEVD